MAAKRIHIIVISAYCTLMLASAGIAADGALLQGIQGRISLKIQAKVIRNAGFTGGAKIPVSPAPVISKSVEVAVNAPKKKEELEDVASWVKAKGAGADVKEFNRMMKFLKVENVPDGTVFSSLQQGKVRQIFVRRFPSQREDEISWMYMTDTVLIMHFTNPRGKLDKAFKIIMGKKPVALPLAEAAEGFAFEKKHWLKSLEVDNRQSLADPKKK